MFQSESFVLGKIALKTVGTLFAAHETVIASQNQSRPVHYSKSIVGFVINIWDKVLIC